MPMHEFVSGKSSVKKQASHVEKEMMEGSRFSGQKVPVSSAQHDTWSVLTTEAWVFTRAVLLCGVARFLASLTTYPNLQHS